MGLRTLQSLLVVLLAGCSPQSPVAPAAAPPPTVGSAVKAPEPTVAPLPAGPAAQHIVVSVSGSLALKRPAWSQFAPASFGTVVEQGDLLRLESPSDAKVACADLSVQLVASGTAGVPCPAGRPALNYQGSTVRATRGDAATEIPQVVSPRRTTIHGERPTIRWTAVSDATGYRVQIRGGNVNWSAEAGAVTQLAYPRDAPALAAGEAYKVTVVASTPRGARSSDEEQTADLGFTLMPAEQRQLIAAGRQRIGALPLGATERRFLVAKLYASDENRLFAEAVEILDELTQALPNEAAIPRLLGELYKAVSLNRLAHQRFSEALSLAEKSQDVIGQALALEALAQLDGVLGAPAEATRRTQQALDVYQRLGDGPKTKELQDRLARLPKA